MNVKFHVKKGDMVFVNAGNEKGKTGKILRVDRKNMRAIVEGLNMVSKNTKPNANNPQGGIIKQEAPKHISNLQLVDPVKVVQPRSDAASTIRASLYVTLKNQGRKSNNGKGS